MIGLPIMLLCLALQAAVSFLERPLLHAANRTNGPSVAGLFPHLRPLLMRDDRHDAGQLCPDRDLGSVCSCSWANSTRCMRLSTTQA